MPTPATPVFEPHLWMTAVAVCLLLLGAAVGRVGGRLVRLFGPARPPRGPRLHGPLATPRCGPRATERAHVPTTSAAPVDVDDLVTGPEERHPHPVPDDEHDDEGPPPPRCPHCRAELRFLRWFPVVASRTFHRRGACPHCEQVIRTGVTTVCGTALLFALVGLWAVRQPQWCPFDVLAVLWLVAVGVPLSVIDVRVMRLPDAIVAPAYLVAFVLLGAALLLPPGGPDPGRAVDALAGMVLVTLLYWLLWRVYSAGLGFGDVKLSGLTGLYAGWAAGPFGALVAIFWAFAAFSLTGIALMALRRLTRKDPFPLGPFMLAGTLATVLAGGALVPHP
ncbi:A24 family peptidase [Nocardiopsis sp. ATB16-24]|uniref:prepilin peptidase n=1 Tax=Nocardiopsis sp. ATB16-24 TaxID=3019555 RepID=UPI0025576844|nr:A24 family peptidase [Nocardiopsis sp. ATB16-24]